MRWQSLLTLVALALTSLLVGACAGQAGSAVAGGSGRSVSEIKAGVMTSTAIDGIHARKNKPCETCHGSLPAFGSPTVPTTAKCLSCHGGTYEGHAARTARLGEQNPHQSHLGQLDCTKCHKGHQPFVLACSECHDLPVPDKYKATT